MHDGQWRKVFALVYQLKISVRRRLGIDGHTLAFLGHHPSNLRFAAVTAFHLIQSVSRKFLQLLRHNGPLLVLQEDGQHVIWNVIEAVPLAALA